jgi:hypothetical protein
MNGASVVKTIPEVDRYTDVFHAKWPGTPSIREVLQIAVDALPKALFETNLVCLGKRLGYIDCPISGGTHFHDYVPKP